MQTRTEFRLRLSLDFASVVSPWAASNAFEVKFTPTHFKRPAFTLMANVTGFQFVSKFQCLTTISIPVWTNGYHMTELLACVTEA